MESSGFSQNRESGTLLAGGRGENLCQTVVLDSMDKSVLDAASGGRLGVVKTLLGTGQMNRKSLISEVVKTRYPCFKPTPLSKAAENGHADVVSELVEFYVEATNFESGCPLHIACLNGHAACVNTIVTHLPHLLNEEDEDGLSPLHIAAKTGHAEVTNILLQAGADVNKTAEIRYLMHRDYGSYTALYLASSQGHADVTEALLANGADPLVEVERDEGCLDLFTVTTRLCPLSVAAYSGHIDVLKILSKVVPLDQTYGVRAVVVAAIKKQNTCLQYLLERGAPTFCFLNKQRQLLIWTEILLHRLNAETEEGINAIKILLNHGMPLKSLVTASSVRLSEIFAGMAQPTLKYLLDSGFFELRYHKYYDPGSGVINHDFQSIIGCFRTNLLLLKVNTILVHFPHSISVLLPLRSHVIDERLYDEIFKNASPLRHLCRWKIRCNMLMKHGFISKDLIVKLKLPPGLQKYLFFQ